MPDYENMYNRLFNQITDTIVHLEAELENLRTIQIVTEELYMDMSKKKDTD
jgi:hypothetical protein